MLDINFSNLIKEKKLKEKDYYKNINNTLNKIKTFFKKLEKNNIEYTLDQTIGEHIFYTQLSSIKNNFFIIDYKKEGSINSNFTFIINILKKKFYFNNEINKLKPYKDISNLYKPNLLEIPDSNFYYIAKKYDNIEIDFYNIIKIILKIRNKEYYVFNKIHTVWKRSREKYKYHFYQKDRTNKIILFKNISAINTYKIVYKNNKKILLEPILSLNINSNKIKLFN